LNRGIALIFTIVVIGLLAVFVIEFSYISRVDTNILANWENERRAYFLARGGVNLGLYLLKMDNPGIDTLAEEWAREIPPFPLDDGVVQLEIGDEDGKISVNKLTEKNKLNSHLGKAALRLFELSAVGAQVFPCLLDYIDEDTVARPGGSEDGCKNDIFYTKTELSDFPGLDDVVEFLTVYSSGRININTAPLSVIQSLSDKINEELAQKIIDYRADKPFGNIAQLGKVPGVTDVIAGDVNKVGTVRSSFFTIKSVATVGDVRKAVVAVVERQEKKGLEIIYWNSGMGMVK